MEHNEVESYILIDGEMVAYGGAGVWIHRAHYEDLEAERDGLLDAAKACADYLGFMVIADPWMQPLLDKVKEAIAKAKGEA